MKRMPLWALNISGILAFAWPLLASVEIAGTASSARADEAPLLFALLIPLMLAVAITEAVSGHIDPKGVALLGILAACSAILRLPLSLAGANLFFILPILGGAIFGVRFGFLLGALGMTASAVITGGIGPWLPFQIWAAGWVGGGAGLLRGALSRIQLRWLSTSLVCLYGACASFAYGALLNLYFWPVIIGGDSAISWVPTLGWAENLRHYRSFYLITSAGWDAVGSLVNVVVLALAMGPIGDLFSRYRRRLSFDWRPAGNESGGKVPIHRTTQEGAP